jgi:putative FmdB family regulatory protein
MPIYEYECSACDHRLEAIQRFSDAPLKKCPECGKPKLRKLISAVGFRLSGKGWYETDFKNDRQRNLSQKDSAEEKKADKVKDAGDSKQDAAKKDGAVKKDKSSTPKKDKEVATKKSSSATAPASN